MKTTYQQLKELYLSDQSASKNIIHEINGPHFWIILNRPKRYNSFTIDMYFTFRELIRKANQLQDVKFIIVTGSGSNFSSGNDLGNFMDEKISNFNPKVVTEAMGVMLQQLCDAIIDSKKPIFAVLQGKTIGFAFTQLAIYDKVFAAQNSQFMAPLVKVAQGPQMCSSYLFPKIFGSKFGEEIIVQGNKINAKQLEKYNFLQTFPTYQKAKEQCLNHCNRLSELEWNSYINSRRLIRDPDRQMLKKVNRDEIINLVQRWNNPDLPQFIMNYMSKQKSQKPKL